METLQHMHAGKTLNSICSSAALKQVRELWRRDIMSNCTCKASSRERQRRIMTQLLPNSPASGLLATLTSVSSAAT